VLLALVKCDCQVVVGALTIPGCCKATSGRTYLYPDFPELLGFLGFWQKSLEGVLHSVTGAHSRLVKPVEIKTVGGIFRLH
jgi:hypothetical protein